jgi:hypothetical protein
MCSVGDDLQSWAYDGNRLKKWHGVSSAYSTIRWNAQDIVGCALDLDIAGGEMRFFLNGKDLGVAYRGFADKIGKGLIPAASLSRGEAMQFAFDPVKMQYAKLDGFAMGPRNKIPPGYNPLEGDKVTINGIYYFSAFSHSVTEG